MFRFKNSSLSFKLTTGFLTLSLVPIFILSFLVWNVAKEALIEREKEKLIALKAAKKVQIESLFQTIKGQVISLSGNAGTISAMLDLGEAFNAIPDKNISKEINASLENFYYQTFFQKYTNENPDSNKRSIDKAFRDISARARYLQYHYISNNKYPLGSKDQLSMSQDGSSWTKEHAKYHTSFREFLTQFGYYDIFLVDLNGNIIYSVYKELDFATSLANGPYATSGLGKIYSMLKESTKNDDFRLTDLEKYYPSYNAPAGFVGSPIFNNESKIGYLIMQIPVEKINSIMTNDFQWAKSGYGNSGESYLVGQDKYMRSISRFIYEDREGYVRLMTDKQLMSMNEVEYAKIKGNSTLVQTVNSSSAQKALAGNSGFEMVKDYRGVSVLSAYTPLDIPGLNWSLLVEMDESESLHMAMELRNYLIGITLGTIVIVLLAALQIAKTISKSLRSISLSVNKTSKGVNSASEQMSVTGEMLSSTSIKTAGNIEETLASMEDLTSVVDRNSASVTKSQELSNTCMHVVRKSEDKMNALIQSMQGIRNSSKEMEEIINVIDDIAFQINLLSLNAAVEAARAGEQGKGFAVVAEAVRSLAGRSSTAAKNITQLIRQSTANISKGVSLAEENNQSLKDIVASVEQVNSISGEVLSSSREQANGINQVKHALAQIEKVTQENASSAEESAQASSELLRQSQALKLVVNELTQLVEGEKYLNAHFHELHSGESSSHALKKSSFTSRLTESFFNKAS